MASRVTSLAAARAPGGLWTIATALWLTAVSGLIRPAPAQYRETFETPETSWKLADRDCSLRVGQHTRTFAQAHSDQASEYIQLVAGHGTFIHFVHAIPPSRIIDELSLGIWLKSNRSHLQLSARVVLPRSLDPRTGAPLTTLIRGPLYQQAGTWEKLTIEMPTKLLSRQVPLLRSELGSDINPREAYIDLLVLNAFGGTGTTDIWIDDLEVRGQVSTGVSTPRDTSPHVPLAGEPVPGDEPVQRDAMLQGSVLLVNGRPFMIRAIDHNGESFGWLKSLGFNAIRLSAPPTPGQLSEAQQSQIGLIVPPPLNQSPEEYGSNLSSILAWDLGDNLSADRIEPTRRLARQLRSVREEACRPVICLPRAETWQYSRIADLLVLEPPGPHSSLPLGEVGQWYLQQSRLMRMGTHFWASIRTQPRPSIREQIETMSGEEPRAWTLEPEQIRLLAYHAVAAGARGLLFRSETRLDTSDRMTILRAKTLEWLNQELSILEPWAATGTHDGEVDTGDPSVRVSVLKTDRARLLIATRRGDDQQYVTGPVDERPVSFEIPSVPETDEAYSVSEEGLQRIRDQRSTGVRITLESPRTVSLVVLTQDQLIINFLARQVSASRKKRDELVGEIAAQMYACVVETHHKLLEAAPAMTLTSHALDGASLAQARSELQHFERLLEGGGHDRAYEFLQRGLQQLAATRYQDWRPAANAFPTPVASPLCVSYFWLPQHYAFTQRLRGVAWGPNALAGGDFENLQHLQASGWKHLSGDTTELATAVELSLHAPHAGRSALRIQCWPRDPQRSPVVIDTPPVVITSAPVSVRGGQIVRVHGWARVPVPVQGSLDGLLIYDSLAGEDLAVRVTDASEWQEFTLYRAAPRDGELTMTLALSGIGEAWIDDLTVSRLSSPDARRETPR